METRQQVPLLRFRWRKKCALPRRGGLLWGGSGLGVFLSVLSRFRLGRGVTLY